MIKRIDVTKVLEKCENVGLLIWKQEAKRYQMIEEIVGELCRILPQFMVDIGQYQIQEIKVEDIMDQLKWMESGLKNRDEILMSDMLNYEIYNTLLIYENFLKIQEENNL